MQEMNPLEKQLQSWIPRRPSAKIAKSLFAQAAAAPAFLRPMTVWNWLTPMAACALAMVVAVNSASRRMPHADAPSAAASFATLMFDSSNVSGTFLLSKSDENVEWNVWTHPFPAIRHSAPALNVLDMAIPTNH